MKKLMIVLAVMAVFGLATAAQATSLGTVTGLVSGDDYEVETADSYLSGGSAGNTVMYATGGYYDGNTWPQNPSDGNYRRDKYSQVYGIGGIWTNEYAHSSWTANVSKTLVTSVSGLAAGQYDVYVLTLSTRNYPGSDGMIAGLSYGTGGDGMTTVIDNSTHAVSDRLYGNGAVGAWTIYAQYVGTTSAGATGFDLYIAPTDAGIGQDFYSGVAYQENIPPIAEPASLGLVGVAFLAMRKRRS